MKCPICNAVLKKDTLFCTSCGTKIQVLKESGLLDMSPDDEPEPDMTDSGMPVAPKGNEDFQAPPVRAFSPAVNPEPVESEPEPEPDDAPAESDAPDRGDGRRKRRKAAASKQIRTRKGRGGVGGVVKIVLWVLFFGGLAAAGYHVVQTRRAMLQAREAFEARRREETRRFYQGLEFIQDGRLKDGVAILEDLVSDSAVADRAPYYLAFARGRQGELAAAARLFALGLQRRPDLVFADWRPSPEAEEYGVERIESYVQALFAAAVTSALGRRPDAVHMDILKRFGLDGLMRELASELGADAELVESLRRAESDFIVRLLLNVVVYYDLDVKTNRRAPLVKDVQAETASTGKWLVTASINASDAPTPGEVRRLGSSSLVRVFREFFSNEQVGDRIEKLTVRVYYSADDPSPSLDDEDAVVIEAAMTAAQAAGVDWAAADPREMNWEFKALSPEFQ